MPFYELVFVTRQDLASSEVDELADKFKKILEQGGGVLVSKEYWGLRTLAYKIKKNSKGHYVLFNIDANYPVVAELERVMGFDENIIRKGIFKIKSISKDPSKLFVSVNAKDKNSAV